MSIVESPDFNEQNVGIWNEFSRSRRRIARWRLRSKRRLERLSHDGLSRPVDAETLDRYTAYAMARMEQGLSFTESMKKVASAALSSPMFLYRAGTTPMATRQFELASNLSFFLWGSGPDRELLRLAESGELSRPEILNQTIERMFADPKIERFLDTFPSQWMQLENVLAATPDPQKPVLQSGQGPPGQLADGARAAAAVRCRVCRKSADRELISPPFSYQSEFLKTWYTTDLQPPAIRRRRRLLKRTDAMS